MRSTILRLILILWQLGIVFLFSLFAAVSVLFAATPTPIPGAAQAIITTEVLNVRAAPSATATIVGRLNKGATVQILARTADNSWWQNAFPDATTRAWIAAQYTQLLDPISTVPILGAATPMPTRTATSRATGAMNLLTATVTRTPTATSTSTNTPTATATPTATGTPTDTLTVTPTSTLTSTPTSTPTLTPTATPTFTPSPSPTPTQQGRNPSAASISYNTDTMIHRFSTIWYRFEYRGDRSPINVTLDSFGVQDLELQIFAPEQVDTKTNEVRGAPVGRGSHTKPQAVTWSGSSPQGGTFYIAVVNKTDRTIIYRLNVTGSAVTASAITAPEPDADANDLRDFPRVKVEVSTPTPRAVVPMDYQLAWDSLGLLLPKLDEAALTNYGIFHPPELGIPPVVLAIPKPPEQCTPPNQVGEVVTRTIKLCPNSVYMNLNVAGAGIGVFGDDAGTAIVKGEGRSFALTAVGERLTLQNLKVQASTDPLDANIWLCLYEKCGDGPNAFPGSTVYGGGILLKASGSLVSDVTVRGGTSGLAIIGGADNYIINSRFLYQTGWSSYNQDITRNYFMGNAFHYANRSCKDPSGKGFYQSGCETAGWVCIGCMDIVLVDNECRGSGNCYYVNGDGGMPSFNVKFFRNTCFGSPNNCFEATYSKGIWFEKNTAARDPKTGLECNYPFWVGGSEIVWGNDNSWGCIISADRAKARSQSSTENP